MKSNYKVIKEAKQIRSKIFLLLFTVGLLMPSCSKDFLVEQPEYTVDASKVFSTEERAELAYQGVLSNLENGFWSNQGYHQLISAAGGFYYRPGSGHIAEYNNFIFKDSQPWPNNVWNDNYNVIFGLNVIINYFDDNFDNLEELSSGYKNVVGKAYFLRAYQYFKLVRLWGDIPMPLKPAVGITHTPLSKESDVYAQVIKDFEQAKLLLPSGTGPNIYKGPIKEAADAFLAKVYATEAGWLNKPELWEKAKIHADLVINSNEYMLLSDLKKLHSTEGRNSEEAIFEIQANPETNLSNLSQAFTPGGYVANIWGGFIRVQPWLWYQQVGDNLYSDNTRDLVSNKIIAIRDHDPRVDITYIDSSYVHADGRTISVYPKAKWASGAYLYSAKYIDKNLTSSASRNNWKVLRYADILLLRAEIENELNGPATAYQYVNKVLERARSNGKGIYPLNWNTSNVATKDDFRKKIAWERIYELNAEGHEFFEARRRGKDFLVNNFISVHNNFNDPVLGALIKTKSTDDGIMHLKIPVGETANNNSID